MGKKRKYIVLGDKTTHGGTVVTAWGDGGRWTIDGKPVACVGDLVTCPECGGVHVIISGAKNPLVTCYGKALARDGDVVSCGAQLISIGQSRSFHIENDDMVAAERAAAEARAAREAARASPAASAGARNDFRVPCWLKALAQRNAFMRDEMG